MDLGSPASISEEDDADFRVGALEIAQHGAQDRQKQPLIPPDLHPLLEEDRSVMEIPEDRSS